MRRVSFALCLALSLVASPAAQAAPPANVECIAPAKPGGGFDLTCRLLRELLQLPGTPSDPQVRIRYLPGGIGALAFDRAVSQHWSDPRTVVAFSTGSLVNLAQGRFGPHRPSDVRWLATLGLEDGVIAVRRDARFPSLAMLRDALAGDPAPVRFGAGGTVGSQDWIKAALLVKASGSDHRNMRFIAFEGGGQAVDALRGGHVDVFCGDMLEVAQAVAAGEIRLLAVPAPQRLGGRLAAVPTAREQGIDIVWPTVRGLYLGPGVTERDYAEWSRSLGRLMQHPGYAALLARYGLQPATMRGPQLQAHVDAEIGRLKALARSLHLRVP